MDTTALLSAAAAAAFAYPALELEVARVDSQDTQGVHVVLCSKISVAKTISESTYLFNLVRLFQETCFDVDFACFYQDRSLLGQRGFGRVRYLNDEEDI